MTSPTAFTAAQQALVALLGRPEQPPTFAAGLGEQLQAELEEVLAPVASGYTPADPLWVSKHALAMVHGCEAHYVDAERRPFTWTVAAARGTVAHKAIELSVHWRGEAPPMDLVDEAIARLIQADGAGLQRFLERLGEGDRSELRGATVDLVSRFQECFPPLRAAWIPVTESRARVELLGGAVILSGKTDLSLGRPLGSVANKVIIDLKSGRPSTTHREDLRFYALLETIKLGVPPRQLASYYLESARAHPEDVTVALLQSALRRTVDGITKIVELAAEARAPSVLPGPACRWCPISDDCPDGRAELQRQDDDGDGSW